MAKELMIPANYEFTESYIPPRCRKPRTRNVRGECEVPVTCVSYDEAPVAMAHRQACRFPEVVEYRWYNGRLYKRSPYNECLSGAKGWWPLEKFKKRFISNCFSPCDCGENADECIENIRKQARLYLIINDDEVWEVCGEPRYVIMTFGLGHNHASTALMIANSFNPNIPWTRYFNALERDAAVKEAVMVATARGDTNSIESIRNSREIEVLIPETVRCNPKEWGGQGDDFLNTLDVITQTADSANEAAVLACVYTAASMDGGSK